MNLKACGDPDHGQFLGSGVLAPTQVHSCGSVEECQNAVRAYIEEHGLGAGNWAGGQIRAGGKIVGRVSFNGRFWPTEQRKKK